jgi:hypothetical protein
MERVFAKPSFGHLMGTRTEARSHTSWTRFVSGACDGGMSCFLLLNSQPSHYAIDNALCRNPLLGLADWQGIMISECTQRVRPWTSILSCRRPRCICTPLSTYMEKPLFNGLDHLWVTITICHGLDCCVHLGSPSCRPCGGVATLSLIGEIQSC